MCIILMFICIYNSFENCIHMHARTHARMRMYAHMHAHTHTHIYTHTHVHIHTDARAYTHTHTHTHTHTYMCDFAAVQDVADAMEVDKPSASDEQTSHEPSSGNDKFHQLTDLLHTEVIQQNFTLKKLFSVQFLVFHC